MGAVWTDIVQIRPVPNSEGSSQAPRALRLSYTQAELGPMEHVVLSPTAERGA
jgi:general secretion pathway protein J